MSSATNHAANLIATKPDDLDMHLIYDVSHNIAKVEEHMVDGKIKKNGGDVWQHLPWSGSGVVKKQKPKQSGLQVTRSQQDVLQVLQDKGIAIRVASPKLVMEEAPESYKDVTQVVDTCHAAGISKKVVKLRPVRVSKAASRQRLIRDAADRRHQGIAFLMPHHQIFVCQHSHSTQ
eukprot:752276-Hanusia_phi.AAC.2